MGQALFPNSPVAFSYTEDGQAKLGNHLIKNLVDRFDTPLYLIDYDTLKINCESYTKTLEKFYPNSHVYYAAKANINVGLLDIISEFGLGADVVSLGELHTALQSKLSPQKILLHGNNKSDEEIQLALSKNICIVIDNEDDLDQILRFADPNKKNNVLLRFTPDIRAETHQHIITGHADSKFGMNKASCLKIISKIFQTDHICCLGLHCHIGSQILQIEPYLQLIETVTEFSLEIKQQTGFIATHLNIGGGLGIAYKQQDQGINIAQSIEQIAKHLIKTFSKHQLPLPKLLLEPGRSIIGNAGCTVYTVGRTKQCQDVLFAFVDGGMADNPRPILYDAPHHFCLASKAKSSQQNIYDIAGKFCESGDILGKKIKLPTLHRGDLLMVLGTGAYNYAMSSNYNRARKPSMLLVKKDTYQELVTRQSLSDLILNDRRA